tara:strand:- start:14 stop:466 length:453 start_codon:yes stop_codon:yes gene_type:complete
MIYKGIWLFGLSGSGKTFLSKKISVKIKNNFLIDGDQFRSLISFDLGFSLKDRKIQNKRVLGLAKIAIVNKFFPIISSVYLDPRIVQDIKKNKIKIIKINSNSENKINKKIKNKRNIVGKSIIQPNIKCKVFTNNYKDANFNELLKMIKI